MNLVLEVLHEHALSIDFAMFVLIGLVQVIVYPVFREIPSDRFAKWHPRYCNQIGWFVLPLMIAQLIDAATTCFFVGDDLSWARFICVFFAWAVTFLISAPCHRRLMREGKIDRVVERLIRTNLWRSLAWTGALIISWLQY
jgi:fatty-acid desaturase